MCYISPFRGAHTPEPIDIPFGVLSGLPDVIISAKLCVDRWTGFCVAAPQIVPFRILFRTTLTTVRTSTVIIPMDSGGTPSDPLEWPLIRVLGSKFWEIFYISDAQVAIHKNLDPTWLERTVLPTHFFPNFWNCPKGVELESSYLMNVI